jgi:tetratricopeptide (TPR) repeat protein
MQRGKKVAEERPSELNDERSVRNPGYATAHQWYSIYLVAVGRNDAAITEIERAVSLDPFSLEICTDLGVYWYYRRDYDRAIEQFRRTIEMDPNFGFPHYNLGRAYEAKGLYREAIDELKTGLALSPGNFTVKALLARAYARAGDTGAARRLLESLQDEEKSRFISPVAMAAVYESLGLRDRAFERLRQAYEGRVWALVLLKCDPMLDSLRSDPRFLELVERLHFPP